MKSTLNTFMSFIVLAFVVPVFAHGGEFGEVSAFAVAIVEFINNTLIPLIFAMALLVFIWGMFTYFILGGGDEEKRENGKKLMLWAIIGFVMMIIIFGLVNMLASGILEGMGQQNTTIDKLPSAPLPGATGGGGE